MKKLPKKISLHKPKLYKDFLKYFNTQRADFEGWNNYYKETLLTQLVFNPKGKNWLIPREALWPDLSDTFSFRLFQNAYKKSFINKSSGAEDKSLTF